MRLIYEVLLKEQAQIFGKIRMILLKAIYSCHSMCYNNLRICEVTNMEFSEKVKCAREQLNMSQEDIARALNVSFATINRWENSKTKPIKMARAIFDEFCEKNGIIFNESGE